MAAGNIPLALSLLSLSCTGNCDCGQSLLVQLSMLGVSGSSSECRSCYWDISDKRALYDLLHDYQEAAGTEVCELCVCVGVCMHT